MLTDYGIEMIRFLVQQAEEKQELERTCEEYLHSSKYLLEQNKRYEEALEEIKFQASLVETSDNVLDAVNQALQNK